MEIKVHYYRGENTRAKSPEKFKNIEIWDFIDSGFLYIKLLDGREYHINTEAIKRVETKPEKQADVRKIDG